jgi:hypothetical protein
MKRVIGNEDEWKKSQDETTYTMDRPRYERCREERGRLECGRSNASMST